MKNSRHSNPVNRSVNDEPLGEGREEWQTQKKNM